MDSTELAAALSTLFTELVEGAPETGAYVLNRGDGGLLASLDRLSAEAASAATQGGATVAAHVDHLRYGLSLMNRWSAGENPFHDADWGQAWDTTTVSEAGWAQLRNALRDEAQRWLSALGEPREASGPELNGMIGSVVHLAYHLGAIRQIHRSLRGPREQSSQS